MRIRLQNGFILVSFHVRDWQDKKGGVRPFVEQLKQQVPRHEREYLGKQKTWKLKDNSMNRRAISQLARATLTKGMEFKREPASLSVLRKTTDNVKIY